MNKTKAIVTGISFRTDDRIEDITSEIPLDSWVYNAVAQLIFDGVVKGYHAVLVGGTTLSRYEAKQIVKMALACKKELDPRDKFIINKLAAEFAAL